MELDNPFLTQGYAGKEYFCDRQTETKKLRTTLENGRKAVTNQLESPLGKSWSQITSLFKKKKSIQHSYSTIFLSQEKKLTLVSSKKYWIGLSFTLFMFNCFATRFFLRTDKSISLQLLAEVKEEIFEENEPCFISYKNLLTDQQ
jgi:hypothetical protein